VVVGYQIQVPDNLFWFVVSQENFALCHLEAHSAVSPDIGATVADAVFDAVAQRRFFVVPHEHVALATTRARLQWMEGGDPPHLDASRAVQP